MSSPHTIIVGAGWAGLSCAVALTQAGQRVTVIEAAAELGGRARTVVHAHQHFDNGQHLLLGAYHAVRELLTQLEVAPDTVLLRTPLDLSWRSPLGYTCRFSPPALRAPWHIALGFLLANGYTVAERYSALRLCLALARSRFHLANDLPLATWLKQQQQPASLIKKLWEPLCLAALNTPITHASSAVFVKVLATSFAHRPADSELLFPRVNLSAVLPHAARQFIEARGGQVLANTRVIALEGASHRVNGVRTSRDIFSADTIVLATPPSVAAHLSAPFLPHLAGQLTSFTYEPICTIYLDYGVPTACLPTPMSGLLDTTTQWLFDHGHWGSPGKIAAVVSGPGPHMALSGTALGTRVAQEIACVFPAWPTPRVSCVIREKRATFSCHSGLIRPDHHTDISNLWLVGDYTNTGFPATLEGAVRSGLRGAQLLLTA